MWCNDRCTILCICIFFSVRSVNTFVRKGLMEAIERGVLRRAIVELYRHACICRNHFFLKILHPQFYCIGIFRVTFNSWKNHFLLLLFCDSQARLGNSVLSHASADVVSYLLTVKPRQWIPKQFCSQIHVWKQDKRGEKMFDLLDFYHHVEYKTFYLLLYICLLGPDNIMKKIIRSLLTWIAFRK